MEILPCVWNWLYKLCCFFFYHRKRHTIMVIIELPELRTFLESPINKWKLNLHIYMYYNHCDDVVTNIMIINYWHQYSTLSAFWHASSTWLAPCIWVWLCSIIPRCVQSRDRSRKITPLTIVGVYNCSACSFDLYVLKRVHLSVVENLHIRNIVSSHSSTLRLYDTVIER